MILKRYSFLIFFILFEILQNVGCVPLTGNDSFNPFSPQLNKKVELGNSEFSGNKLFEGPSEEKIIEKRRLLYKENDLNSLGINERQSENEYWSRKRTNYSETENEKQITEHHQEFNNWENGRNRVSFPLESENSRNFGQILSRQPPTGQTNSNQQYDWDKRTEVVGKSLGNKEKNLQQFSNPGWDTGIDYENGRPLVVIKGGEKNTFLGNENDHDFNRRVSITTLSNEEMGNAEHYTEKVGEIPSGYLGHPNKNYFNKNPNGFWNPNFYRPEKGVIINFNTECPTPRQYNNQLVHKFIITPKSPITSHSEVSSFQIPEAAFISTPRMTPMYYL